MLTIEELNRVIKEIRVNEKSGSLPYQKGNIKANTVIRILKKYTDYGGGKNVRHDAKQYNRT